jgi:hypothetical protein
MSFSSYVNRQLDNERARTAQLQGQLRAARSVIEAMCAEFRALDLPYGSEAYAAAIAWLNNQPKEN